MGASAGFRRPNLGAILPRPGVKPRTNGVIRLAFDVIPHKKDVKHPENDVRALRNDVRLQKFDVRFQKPEALLGSKRRFCLR